MARRLIFDHVFLEEIQKILAKPCQKNLTPAQQEFLTEYLTYQEGWNFLCQMIKNQDHKPLARLIFFSNNEALQEAITKIFGAALDYISSTRRNLEHKLQSITPQKRAFLQSIAETCFLSNPNPNAITTILTLLPELKK